MLLLIAPFTEDCRAASWQWSKQGTRERLTLTTDRPSVALGVARTGTTTLTIHATRQGDTSENFSPQGTAFAGTDMLADVQPSPSGLNVHMHSPAFGYLVTRPAAHRLVIDVFYDPLGARWTPTGDLAPASVAAPFHAVRPALAPVVPPSPISPSPATLKDMETNGTVADTLPDSRDEVTFTGNLLAQTLSLTAHAAAPPAAAVVDPLILIPPGERGIMVSPQRLLGRVNTTGPEGWPPGEALTTTLSSGPGLGLSKADGTVSGGSTAIMPVPPPAAEKALSPAPSLQMNAPLAVSIPTDSAGGPSQDQAPPPTKTTNDVAPPASSAPPAAQTGTTTMRAGVGPTPGGNATRPVIYMDEAGNVVPKPPEPDKILEEAERLLEGAQHAEALVKLIELKALNISRELREKVLYLISDAIDGVYTGKPLEGFEPLVSATSEAMNANLRSSRVPDALFRLGMAHLRVGNIGEAEGHFRALQRRYPHDINVPHAFVNLGKVMLEKNLFAQAAEKFRYILQEYPESSVLRDASVGLIKALVTLGDLKQAEIIADFVDKRWPRYYLTEPSFLELLARLDLGLGRLEPALQQYWLYYNLDPERKTNDVVLALLGDIYLRTSRPQAAMEIFSEIQRRFPDSTAAELALLRMAEGGIHDSPITIAEMDKVFNHPGTPLPQVAYREVMRRWPGSPRAVLSQLKLAMWMLWDKQYTDAMGAAADFIDVHPENPHVEQAREIIMRAFLAELKNSLAEENYGRILILWNGFPLVRERYGPMDPELRNALARGYLERGDDEKAMELFAEFLKTPKHPRYSDHTFALFFNKYLQAGDWNALLDLGETVRGWEMTAPMRGQLEYAMALAAENLGLAERALPLWKTLAAREETPLYQRAYATYFLAKDAERRKDIKDAYTYNKETLNLFGRLQQERSDKADPERIKEAMGALMDITEVANRIPEALDWVGRYAEFVPEGSPEYPGLLFREARLYRKLGDTTKAKSLLEHLMTKAPDSPFAKAAETELRTFAVSRDLRNFMPKTP